MRLITGLALLALTPLVASCQQSPSFEVASIRLNKTGIRGGSMEIAKGGERFTATNMPLGALILAAYNITVRQLSGPEALSQKYDIAAKAEQPVNSDTMLRMLQTLLMNRFKLIVRRETKDAPVYALTIGKGGPKLHQSDQPRSEGLRLRTPSSAGGAEPRSGLLVFKNESMPDFAWALSRAAGVGDHVVVDHTGLTGTYDFELTFDRDNAPTPAQGPSIFSALSEQLGLKLEARREPVEFVIVEHVEQPSEN